MLVSVFVYVLTCLRVWLVVCVRACALCCLVVRLFVLLRWRCVVRVCVFDCVHCVLFCCMCVRVFGVRLLLMRCRVGDCLIVCVRVCVPVRWCVCVLVWLC